MRRLFLFLVGAGAALAQGGGAVTGTVINAITQAPVAGATVELRQGGKMQSSSKTDASGGFRFASVQEGEYTLFFLLAGFAQPPESHTARKGFRVTAKGEPVRLDFAVMPWGNISGRVLDNEGQAATRVQVDLLRLHGGGRSQGVTDLDGRFRILVEPGAYVLLVNPGRRSPPRNAPLEKMAEPPQADVRTVWAPTYYPDALERTQAAPIQIRYGSDLSGYDVRLRAVPVRKLAGAALDQAGRPVAGATVQLVSDEFYYQVEKQVKTGENGRFEFPDVRPGKWHLTGSIERGKIAWKGLVSGVDVGRDDVENVQLRLLPPFTMTGFVDREEPRDQEGKRLVSAVYLMGDSGEAGLQRLMAFHEQDGSLKIPSVYPGRYRIGTLGFKPGYYVESVKLGELEVFGKTVEVLDGSLPIRVTYRPNAGRARGKVENGAGKRVVLVPQDEPYRNGQFIRTAVCAGDGTFEVGSLRPGEYYAFAFEEVVESNAFEDPAFLRLLLPRAERLQIRPGEAAPVELKPTPWPE